MTKSCDLKGQQKHFFLLQGVAASCCQGQSEALGNYSNLDQLIAHWQKEKQQLDQGLAVSSCSVCWQKENQGQTSLRLMSQGTVGNLVELAIDNACNQMCSYCSPKFSSTWRQSIEAHGAFDLVSNETKQNLSLEFTANTAPQWLDAINQYVQSQPANTVTLKLTGGEPLMQIKNLQTLLELLGDRVAQLRINTNLNPPNNKFLIWLLNRVPAQRLFFDISLDATLAFNHVPRAGFDQLKFAKNLELVQQYQVGYQFISVISVLNVFDLPNLMTWAQHQPGNFKWLVCRNPACLSAELLPDRFKQQIDTTNLPAIAGQLLQPNPNPVDFKLFEQYNYLNQYFLRTQIDPGTTANTQWNQYWQWLQQRYQ